MSYTHQFPSKAIPKTWYQPYKNSGKTKKPSSNLRELFGAIRDQMMLGSCSAFASTNFRSALLVQEGKPNQVFSALAQYYQERVLNGTVGVDSGATMQESMQVLETYGVIPDSDWPYLPNYLERFKVAPPSDWNTSLSLNADHVLEIQQATILEDTIDALSNDMFVMFGFVVFPDLESQQVADTGYLPMPIIPTGQSPFFGNIGGHQVIIIGHDDSTQQFLCLNQWGQSWGIKQPESLQGCFYMPYAYYKQYAFNPVVYSQVESNKPLETYSMGMSVDHSVCTVGETSTVFVKLDSSPSKDMSGLEVIVTTTKDGEILSSTIKTDAKGEIHFPVISASPVKEIISASYHDPMGIQYLKSVSVEWVEKKPEVVAFKSVYEVTLTSKEEEDIFLSMSAKEKWDAKKV